MCVQVYIDEIFINLAEYKDPNWKNEAGKTPLHQVMDLVDTMHAQTAFLEAIMEILAMGADPRIVDNDGYKPIDCYPQDDYVRTALIDYETILNECDQIGCDY
jgi:ankyrin repeat protein